jgi:hypothetical protein
MRIQHKATNFLFEATLCSKEKHRERTSGRRKEVERSGKDYDVCEETS